MLKFIYDVVHIERDHGETQRYATEDKFNKTNFYIKSNVAKHKLVLKMS